MDGIGKDVIYITYFLYVQKRDKIGLPGYNIYYMYICVDVCIWVILL